MRVESQCDNSAAGADEVAGPFDERNVAQVNSIKVPDGDGLRLRGGRGHMQAHRWHAKCDCEGKK